MNAGNTGNTVFLWGAIDVALPSGPYRTAAQKAPEDHMTYRGAAIKGNRLWKKLGQKTGNCGCPQNVLPVKTVSADLV